MIDVAYESDLYWHVQNEKKGQPPAGFETPDEFFARCQIIPLVPVNDFSRAPAIKALQATRSR